jgi:RHS repeat-associated protein
MGGLVLVARLLTESKAVAVTGLPSPGALSQTSVTLPGQPASVAGLSDAASVDVFSGQVRYSVPLDMPEGRLGFAPSLSLAYSGELGNGPLGVGWHLGGFAIQRTLRLGVPHYTDQDEFELVGVGEGGRLFADPKVPGRYWVEKHGLEIKVDRRGAQWEVVDANGTRYFFGEKDDSVAREGTRRLRWHVDRIVDVTGLQRIVFSYVKHAGEIYLSRITWGPDDVFSVRADLVTRRDPVTSWRAGFPVRTERRYARFVVWSHGQILRSYELTYEDQETDAPKFAISRLVQMTMRGRQAPGVAPSSLPPLRFKYAEPTASGIRELEGTDHWRLEERGVTVFDVDGDGMADLLRVELGGHTWRKNLGGRFDDPRPVRGAEDTDLGQVRFLDLDGDARPELIRVINDVWRVYSLAGQGNTWSWKQLGEWQGSQGVGLHDTSSVFADVDGDGQTDVIQAGAGGIRLRKGITGGLGPALLRPQLSSEDSDVEPGRPEVRFADINGDGLVDLAYLTDEFIKSWLGRGDGTFVLRDRLVYPWSEKLVRPEDIKLEDLNRDGLIDIVRFTAGHVVWFPGLPAGGFDRSKGRFIARPAGAAVDSTVTVADINGNGSHEVVWSSPEALWALDFAGTATAGMLESIDNGLGKKTSFIYVSSAILSVQSELHGATWDNKLPVSIPVPVVAEIDVGAGGPKRIVQYGVKDGLWDGEERRFGGFLTATRTVPDADPRDALVEETRFLPGSGRERVLRGLIAVAESRRGDGAIFTRSETQWRALPVAGLPEVPLSLRPARLRVTSDEHEGVPEPIRSLSTFEYDEQVRPIIEHHFGRVGTPGDERELVRRYGDDDNTWVRGRVCLESLFKGRFDVSATGEPPASNLTSRTTTFYGEGDAAPLGLCRPGKGWVRQVFGFLDSEGRDVRLSESTYDSFGNPLTVYGGGVTRSVGYDSQSFRPVKESVTPRAGRTLAWSVDWDVVLGQPRALTDPNLITTRIGYDGLGRVVEVALADRDPHLRYRYEWQAPRPRTISAVWDRELGSEAPATEAGEPPAGWRVSESVANGAGEDLYTATYLGEPARRSYIITGWKERDDRGRVTVVADPFYFGSTVGDLPVARPATGFRAQTLAYDSRDRLVRQTLPNGGEKSILYRAFEQTVTASELAPVTTSMDGLGRIVETKRLVNGTLETVNATHDAADRITLMRLQGGEANHEFAYDSLGRLTFARDEDIGERWMTYFDEGWLKTHQNGAGQILRFEYDGAGRIVRRIDQSANNRAYDFHYDDVPSFETGGSDIFTFERCVDVATNLKGRLSWVREPAGFVCMGYDQLGRETLVERVIAPEGTLGETFSTTRYTTLAASGQMLGQRFEDGFEVVPSYDRAGRPVRLAQRNSGIDDVERWRAELRADGTRALDASGRVEEEVFGNQLRQKYLRDELGLPRDIDLLRPAAGGGASSLYHVGLTRNLYGAPRTVSDVDGRGLDHTAAFHYDGAARLIGATQGAPGPGQFSFRYKYDGLQNMVARAANGPADVTIGVLAGYYRHGGMPAAGSPRAGRDGMPAVPYGPRQITKVDSPKSGALCGTPSPSSTESFDYDLAGRMVAQGARRMTFDAYDQLTGVTGHGGPPATYEYGFDGLRTVRREGGEVKELWFSEDHAIRDGGSEREHVISLGARLIARVGGARDPATGLFLWGAPRRLVGVPVVDAVAWAVVFGLCVLLLLQGFIAARRRRRWSSAGAGLVAAAVLGSGVISGCGGTQFRQQAVVWTDKKIVYQHQGIAAGPVVFTDGTGAVREERRYDPFGAELDVVGESGAIGGLARDPQNILNKETDKATGWSYHGARWMAQGFARWLSPDPPVKAPDGRFMEAPWALNPYSYVLGNPLVFWDPDGLNPDGTGGTTGTDQGLSGAEGHSGTTSLLEPPRPQLVIMWYPEPGDPNETIMRNLPDRRTHIGPRSVVNAALESINRGASKQALYNIRVGGPLAGHLGTRPGLHPTQQASASGMGATLGLLLARPSAPKQAASGANLNANTATSNFGLYEIEVGGSLHKIGKADLGRVTQSSGLPTRLHQQVRKLEQVHGKGNVVGQVVQDLGQTTTAAAKAAETARLKAHHKATGVVPPGNQKSFKP